MPLSRCIRTGRAVLVVPAVVAGLGLAGAMPTPAVARTPIAEMLCSLRVSMEQRLTVQFRSARTAVGVRDADSVMEVWTEPGTGNWTMVVTYASGTSCIVAMGSHWETRDAPPATTDAG